MTQNTQTLMRPALIGGASLGVASAIPPVSFINCACCALVIGGGVLAAYLYMKDAPPAPSAPLGAGLLLGGLTGVIGAVTSTIVGIPVNLLMSAIGMRMGGGLAEMFESADLPPEALEMMEMFGSGGFSLMAILISFLVSLVIYPIFAGIGALIGVAIFNKKPLVTE